MSAIKNLRERLEVLETALQDAGLALLLARESADKDDLKRVLKAFGLATPRNKRRVEWLEEMGRVAAWHEGLCASSTADVETHAAGQCPEPLLRTEGSDPMVNPGGVSPEIPVQRAL